MSARYYKNRYAGLPDTRVCLYHSEELDPTALETLQVFCSITRTSKHVLITDSNVASLHLPHLIRSLTALDIHVHPIIFSAGERSKNLDTYVSLLSQCNNNIDKESSIISFGGGVVKDLAGFLASTLYRGLNLVHIPTTVLAQVDAAIDCNQSVNLPYGKNLVGTWYSPSEIWVNTAFLRTLPERWIRDGLGESIKHAMCHGPKSLDLLTEARVHDFTWLKKVVDVSNALKVRTMRGEAEWEDAAKHYGHTPGHAIEHLSAGTLGHGESVSIGMCISAELAMLAGLSDNSTLKRHYDVCTQMGLPTRIPDDQSPGDILTQIRNDKLYLGGQMYAPVLTCIGKFAEDKDGRIMIPFKEDLVLRALERNKEQEITEKLYSRL